MPPTTRSRGEATPDLAVISSGRYPVGMPAPDAAIPAHEAIGDFIRHLADRQFAVSTRRIRRHFPEEYLHHVQRAADTTEVTVGELMVPARAYAWLDDAAAGKTRTRNTLRGPSAAAYPNSMRVRIDSYNAFAEYLGLPGRLDSRPPARGFYLTPTDTERLVHDLTVRRPIHANALTSLRTAALAALVADTGRGVPELAHLKVGALHLDDQASVDLGDESCPLSDATVLILTRWLAARAAAGRPPAREARRHASGGPHPACRPSQSRQPAARHPAPPRCPPFGGP